MWRTRQMPGSTVRRGFSACQSDSHVGLRKTVQNMRTSEIKRELHAAGVSTAGMIEKNELIDSLVQARSSGASMSTPPGTASSSTPSSSADEAVPLDKQLFSRCRSMSVKELRTELGARGVSWADCLDKDELVERLAKILADEAKYCSSGRFRPGRVQQITGSELTEELQDKSVPLLLDVFANWCGPCKQMAPELENAAKRLGSRVRVTKMDTDQEAAMSSQLKVSALPTVILFNRAGKEIARQQGALSEPQLIEFFERHSKAD